MCYCTTLCICNSKIKNVIISLASFAEKEKVRGALRKLSTQSSYERGNGPKTIYDRMSVNDCDVQSTYAFILPSRVLEQTVQMGQKFGGR